jgi:hypothetical protein
MSLCSPAPRGLLKLGVAAAPSRRLRNLQVGSPVPLKLAAGGRSTAEAVGAALAGALSGAA